MPKWCLSFDGDDRDFRSEDGRVTYFGGTFQEWIRNRANPADAALLQQRLNVPRRDWLAQPSHAHRAEPAVMVGDAVAGPARCHEGAELGAGSRPDDTSRLSRPLHLGVRTLVIHVTPACARTWITGSR